MTPRPPRRRAPPVSIRFNEQQLRTLSKRAGGMPLGTYIKYALFSPDAPVVRKSPTVPVDRELLARALAALGASRVSSNLSQLAKHANLGNLFCDDEVAKDLNEACAQVREVRDLLLRGLGKHPTGSGSAA